MRCSVSRFGPELIALTVHPPLTQNWSVEGFPRKPIKITVKTRTTDPSSRLILPGVHDDLDVPIPVAQPYDRHRMNLR